ncbi:hypothetical protein ACSHWB_32700 [Lentzea sp. HUAS TT2]|uniref:hypothetical protein n=1 Tax=Lentzea sp. HUAS TT2 TaxID=3447454 RepID=UPI003F6F8EC1
MNEREAQELQLAITGHLPGHATPRIVRDVPHAGKRWVHQLAECHREPGISPAGQKWWSDQT